MRSFSEITLLSMCGVYQESCIIERHDLYPLLSIIGKVKRRRMRWVGNVECMECERSAYRVFKGELEYVEVCGVVGMMRTVFVWLRIETSSVVS
jgi:hypothetical protein